MSPADDDHWPEHTRVRLHAVGGLCNRLRAILSYRAVHGAIDVVWMADEYVSHAQWEDVFEPVPGVRFVEGGWTVRDSRVAKDAPTGWQDQYSLLRPTAAVAMRVRNAIGQMGGTYAAVHVRRTDHIPNVGGEVKPLTYFADWANELSFPIYVATDNGETQAFFRARWPLRAHFGATLGGAEAQGLLDHHRNGALSDAVVDLFVCAEATAFQGTRRSSFTDTIYCLRKLRARLRT